MIFEKSESSSHHWITERMSAIEQWGKLKDIIVPCIADLESKFDNISDKAFDESLEILYDSFYNLESETYRRIDSIRRYSTWLYQHSIDVAVISLVIADQLHYKRNEKKDLCIGALFHDIGKLLIPKEILQKPGRLCDYEMQTMKQHSVLGYNMTKDLCIHKSSKLIVLQHHERIDGSGYPFGLFKESISDNAKIVMVADALDAMTSYRPYRAAQTMREAIENIKRENAKYPNEIIKIVEQL